MTAPSWLDTARGIIEKATEAESLDFCNRSVRAFLIGADAQHTFTDFLRVSSLHDVCPREFVINYWNPVPNKSFDPKHVLMMNLGTIFHSYMQDSIFGPMGILTGTWVRYEFKDGVGQPVEKKRKLLSSRS